MKDLDYSLNGSDNEKEYFKTLKVIEHKLESLILIIERSRIREYMMLTDNKRRLFVTNFVAGLGRGFGQAIGFTLLAALVIYFISEWVNLPIIGRYIAEFLDIVDKFKSRIKNTTARTISAVEEILEEINQKGQPVIFLGDGVPVQKETIAKMVIVPYQFAPAHLARQRAGALGALAQVYYKEGRYENARDHKPDYLRLSQAERERMEKEKGEQA